MLLKEAGSMLDKMVEIVGVAFVATLPEGNHEGCPYGFSVFLPDAALKNLKSLAKRSR